MIFWAILGSLLGLVAAYILLLVIAGLAVSTKKEYSRHSPFYRWLLGSATWLGVELLRIRIHISGAELLPKDTRKLLFVSNHRSKFDPIITWHALSPYRISFISKPENFKIPIFGRLIRKCCFLAIDRENPRNAIRTIQSAAALLDGGELSVGVYPEGKRSLDATLLPFHNGVFKIAQKAGAPIVVLTVSGTEQVHKNFPLRRTHIYLDVLAVIPAEQVTASRTEALGTQISDIMNKNLEKQR